MKSYVFCQKCGHLNGIFEDGEDFANSVYSDDAAIYGDNYFADTKNSLMKELNIYDPKADFLFAC